MWHCKASIVSEIARLVGCTKLWPKFTPAEVQGIFKKRAATVEVGDPSPPNRWLRKEFQRPWVYLGDRQPHTIPTKDLLHQGWCANFSNLRKRQNTHHPQFCTRDVDRQFCGGGAWISGADLPLPQGFGLRGTKLRPWSKQNSDQNSDDARLCIYQGKEKLRPWSKFLGTQTMVWVSVSQGVGVGPVLMRISWVFPCAILKGFCDAKNLCERKIKIIFSGHHAWKM